MIERIRKLLDRFERALLALATAGLVLMMLSISLDALGRHIFRSPFRGNFELVSLYLMVILVFGTLSGNYANGSHVRLDIVSASLKTRFGGNYDRAIALVCLPVFMMFAWYSANEAIGKFAHLETRMGAIPFPIYLSYVWVALGACTLAARFLLDIISPSGNELDENGHPHEGGEPAS